MGFFFAGVVLLDVMAEDVLLEWCVGVLVVRGVGASGLVACCWNGVCWGFLLGSLWCAVLVHGCGLICVAGLCWRFLLGW